MVFPSLAYLDIIPNKDNPLATIEYSIQKEGLLEGFYHASVTLSRDVAPKGHSAFYSSADGSGTHPSKHTAISIAISEGLERWAYRSIHNETNHDLYGFNIDNSTSGMAAFPRYSFLNYARKHATKEAMERWSMQAFNKGKLQFAESIKSIDNLTHHILHTPFRGKDLLISTFFIKEIEAYAYSFSIKNRKHHISKLDLIELDRNIHVISRYSLNKKRLFNTMSDNDKRILFFSTRNGHDTFTTLLNNNKSMAEEPELIVSKEIKGPWSKYAKVWRTLYDPIDTSWNESNEKYFLF